MSCVCKLITISLAVNSAVRSIIIYSLMSPMMSFGRSLQNLGSVFGKKK